MRRLLLAGLSVLALNGCDFIDPSNVTNPRTTDEDLSAARKPTEALLPGLRAQFARALGATVVTSETVSDNYMIRATGLSAELDDPTTLIPDVTTLNATDATGAYWNLQELKALANFTLTVAETDTTATPKLIAEALYYRALALVMLAENFVAVPLERDQPAQPASVLLQRAEDDLDQLLTLDGSGLFALPARAALARLHRMVGDETSAASFAERVLAENGRFLFLQQYSDGEVPNLPFTFSSFRALREMQPLPRLDFLDPKHVDLSSPIAVAKAEEMHLILAEAALALRDEAAARAHIGDAVALALTRPIASFDDNDPRNNSNLTVRPRDALFVIRADANSPFRAGLIQTRPGVVQTPTTSGTSLNPDSVRALPAADREAIVHALYLARQEILFLEGRRMSDLGIRLPMSRREIDTNPNIDEGSPGTTVRVPAFVPAGRLMDDFTPASPYADLREGTGPTTTQITITVDMNRRVAQNYATVSPF